MAKSPALTLSLKGRALRALSQREYTLAELTRKLQSFEEFEGQLEAVLTEMRDKGFLSDERAIASHINRRASKLGLGRIKQELQAKGADADMVRSAMGHLEGGELERAQQVWAKKFAKGITDRFEDEGGGAEDRNDESAETKALRIQFEVRERSKQIRFLLSRGFSMQIAQSVVRSGGALE